MKASMICYSKYNKYVSLLGEETTQSTQTDMIHHHKWPVQEQSIEY